jgi:hypothetical protein
MMGRGRASMRYLGGLRGNGTLRCGGQILAPADYDLDGYLVPPTGVAGSGEIRTAPEVLRKVFGRRDLELVTAEGRTLSFRFSEKKLTAGDDAAHVDVTAGMAEAKEWRAA